MNRIQALLLVLGLFSGTASRACSCEAPPVAEMVRKVLADETALVVLVERVDVRRRGLSLALSPEHLQGALSPWRGAEFERLRVLRSWSRGVRSGDLVEVLKVDGAACGYEAWAMARRHFLVLHRQAFWTAGLCGASAPEPAAGAFIAEMERQLRRRP